MPGEDPKPADYVTITFDKGAGEELLGTYKFHVKKGETVDLTSLTENSAFPCVVLFTLRINLFTYLRLFMLLGL